MDHFHDLDFSLPLPPTPTAFLFKLSKIDRITIHGIQWPHGLMDGALSLLPLEMLEKEPLPPRRPGVRTLASCDRQERRLLLACRPALHAFTV